MSVLSTEPNGHFTHNDDVNGGDTHEDCDTIIPMTCADANIRVSSVGLYYNEATTSNECEEFQKMHENNCNDADG